MYEVMKMKKVSDKVKRNIYYVSTLTGVIALALVVTFVSKSTDRKQEQVRQYMNEQMMEEQDSMATMEDVPQHDIILEDQYGEEEVPAFAEEKSTEESAQENTAEAGYDGETKMDWPVTGNVLLPYSMDTTVYFKTLDQYKCNPAVLIEAKKGDSVSSVAPGTVIAKENGMTGETITIDMGNGYQAVYGQLDKVAVNVGDRVQARTILGKVAKPSRFYTKEGAHLYFQMKKDEKPVNPMNYLK